MRISGLAAVSCHGTCQDTNRICNDELDSHPDSIHAHFMGLSAAGNQGSRALALFVQIATVMVDRDLMATELWATRNCFPKQKSDYTRLKTVFS